MQNLSNSALFLYELWLCSCVYQFFFVVYSSRMGNLHVQPLTNTSHATIRETTKHLSDQECATLTLAKEQRFLRSFNTTHSARWLRNTQNKVQNRHIFHEIPTWLKTAGSQFSIITAFFKYASLSGVHIRLSLGKLEQPRVPLSVQFPWLFFCSPSAKDNRQRGNGSPVVADRIMAYSQLFYLWGYCRRWKPQVSEAW